jgi:hypothetical protein
MEVEIGLGNGGCLAIISGTPPLPMSWVCQGFLVMSICIAIPQEALAKRGYVASFRGHICYWY